MAASAKHTREMMRGRSTPGLSSRAALCTISGQFQQWWFSGGSRSSKLVCGYVHDDLMIAVTGARLQACTQVCK